MIKHNVYKLILIFTIIFVFNINTVHASPTDTSWIRDSAIIDSGKMKSIFDYLLQKVTDLESRMQYRCQTVSILDRGTATGYYDDKTSFTRSEMNSLCRGQGYDTSTGGYLWLGELDDLWWIRCYSYRTSSVCGYY